MDITVDSVTFSIPFAFQDPKDIRDDVAEGLREIVIPSQYFKNKYGEVALSFIIVLNRNTKELEIKGPTYDKELVDYAIWLPYKKIKNSENIRLSYFSYIREAIILILKKYKFEIDKIIRMFDLLEKSVATRQN